MYNEQTLKKALEKFDWPAVLAHLPDHEEESLKKLFTDVARTGILIRVFALLPAVEQKRKAFIAELTAFVEGTTSENAKQYLKFLLSQVEITEAALRDIEKVLASDLFSSLPEAHQAWSILDWSAREMLDVFRQGVDSLEETTEGAGVVVDPLTLRLDKANGQGLADGRLFQLAETAANTLRMLGHQGKWSQSGNFQLPPRCLPSQDEIAAAQRVSRLGDVWQDLMDESRYHRYIGGHFEPKLPNNDQLAVLPNLELVFSSEKTERERRDDAQVAEYVAHSRAARWTFSVARRIARSGAKKRIKNPKAQPVALAPTELVSELEFTALYVADNVFHWNALKGTDEIEGLTIVEWLRGYSILEECYARDEVSGMDEGIVEIEPSELEATLIRGGLSAAKATRFIALTTFTKGRRDLYDAPLLRSSDGRLYFLRALYHGINLPLVLASQFGSLKYSLDEKGKTFEKSVLADFKDAGIPADSFKFKLGGIEYDCDVAVLWDRQLIVFECKNYSLPNDDPEERFYFWQKQSAAMEQVQRIARDLADNPEIVRRHLGKDAEWDHVHAVVLNAMPFSIRRSPTGVYFYDASALGRFLREGALNKIVSVPRADDEPFDVSYQIKRLWRGDQPTASDLLKEMEYPSQIAMEEDKYYIARRVIPISGTTALGYFKASSKPPNFEPLLTEDQMAELREQVSRRRPSRGARSRSRRQRR